MINITETRIWTNKVTQVQLNFMTLNDNFFIVICSMDHDIV